LRVESSQTGQRSISTFNTYQPSGRARNRRPRTLNEGLAVFSLRALGDSRYFPRVI